METGNDGSKGIALKENKFKKREQARLFFTLTFNLQQVIIKEN